MEFQVYMTRGGSAVSMRSLGRVLTWDGKTLLPVGLGASIRMEKDQSLTMVLPDSEEAIGFTKPNSVFVNGQTSVIWEASMGNELWLTPRADVISISIFHKGETILTAESANFDHNPVVFTSVVIIKVKN